MVSPAIFNPLASFFARAAEAPIVRDAVQGYEAAGLSLDRFASGDLVGGIEAFGDASFRFARVAARFGIAAVSYAQLTDGEREEGLLERGAQSLYGAGLHLQAFGDGILFDMVGTGLVIGDKIRGRDVEERRKEVHESFMGISARLAARDPKKLAANHNLLKHVDFEDRDALWSAALKELKRSGKSLPWHEIRTYDAFQRYLYDAGIQYPQRIQSIVTGIKLAENAQNLSKLGSERPIAVVLSNKADYNGAFEAKHFPMLDRLVQSRQFDVVTFEVGGDFEAAAALMSVYQASGHKVALTVFSGHGDGEALTFSEKWGERGALDVDDLRKKTYLTGLLQTAIADNGQVFLDSCFSGAEDVPLNLGDAMAAALPGRDIFGTSVENTPTDIEISNGRLRRVDFQYGNAYVKFKRRGDV